MGVPTTHDFDFRLVSYLQVENGLVSEVNVLGVSDCLTAQDGNRR